MKTIEIDDELYSNLLGRSIRIGESASEILRRELKAVSTNGPNKEVVAESEQRRGGVKTVTNASSPFGRFLDSSEFLVQPNAVGRFLAILRWLYQQNTDTFDAVLRISGRERRYFARSEEDLEKFGTSVMPKRIPDTPYFVVTNNDTSRKRKIVEAVMRSLNYRLADIVRVSDALR